MSYLYLVTFPDSPRRICDALPSLRVERGEVR